MISRYERFAFDISCIHRCIQKIERDEMEKFGYKGVFAQYLAALYRYPEGLTSMQLSEICDKDKAAVSRAVGEMVEKNLIYRQSINENDTHYRALLMLTEEGQSAAQYVRERGQAAVNLVAHDLTGENQHIFDSALSMIAANLEAVCKSGLPEA